MDVQSNFVCAVEANAQRFASRHALLWQDGKLTWSELDRYASGFARQLSTQGVNAGDRVALLLPNSVEFVVAFLAVLKLGATPAPLNPLVKEEELAAFKADLRPKLSVDRVVMSAGSWKTLDNVDAPSLILYTSGSTGRPKGSVFSHDALTFANHSWAEPVMGLTSDDTVLVAVPLAHSLGLNGGLLAPLLTGASIVLLERFTPEAVFTAIREHHVTVLPGARRRGPRRRSPRSPSWSGRCRRRALSVGISRRMARKNFDANRARLRHDGVISPVVFSRRGSARHPECCRQTGAGCGNTYCRR